MNTVNTGSKSLLSKLLASENIHVVHDKDAVTASFDIKDRVLRLPIMKGMTEEVYDMFVGHEVSHALYTPFTDKDMESLKNNGFLSSAMVIADNDKTLAPIAHQYMNVVEDARIERLIKNKFNGLRRDFFIGYRQLNEKDFFGIKKKDINTLSFIDRINLHFKIGSIVTIPFSDEEKQYVDMVENTVTFNDSVDVAKKIWDYVKEKKQDEQNSNPLINIVTTNDGDIESTFGQGSTDKSDGNENASASTGTKGATWTNKGIKPDEATTQQSFDHHMNKMIDTDRYRNSYYFSLPQVNINNVIIPFSTVLSEFDDIANFKKSEYAMSEMEAQKFIQESKRVVNILAQEFLAKKAAKEHHRLKTNRTGVIDSIRMMRYHTTDDIFKRSTVIHKGKSHGLVFFLDMSGSMSPVLEDTVKQMIQLVLFCHRVNIPYEVYGFTTRMRNGEEAPWDVEMDGDNYQSAMNYIWKKSDAPSGYQTECTNPFSLINLFSSKMKKQQMFMMVRNMVAFYRYYKRGRDIAIPPRMELSSTPLCETIIAAMDIVPEFKRKNNLDIVNTIFLTDGEPTGTHIYATDNTYVKKNKQVFKYDSKYNLESNMIDIFKSVTGMKAISFFICDTKTTIPPYIVCGYSYGSNPKTVTEQTEIYGTKQKMYIKEGWTTALPTATKYDEKFIIRGNSEVEYVDLDEVLSQRKTNASICSNFIKAMNKNMVSRIMLNRFIDLIAKD